jgi:hypothetical protein
MKSNLLFKTFGILSVLMVAFAMMSAPDAKAADTPGSCEVDRCGGICHGVTDGVPWFFEWGSVCIDNYVQ